MAETETPPVVAPETLVPARNGGASMLDRWIASDPKAAMERVETMVKVLEQLRAASIRATYPSDWIIHSTVDRDGQVTKQVGYLQDSGAERAGKVWGIEVGNPAIEREDFPDGTYSYHMIAEAWSKVTGERLDYAEGSRWSGDIFFARQKKTDEDRIDPTDVRKASYANLHGRAVRALSGLNGVPLDMLRQAGIDVGKVVHVSYKQGEKGGESSGAATVGTAETVMAFGNAKGKKVSELDDKDLAWYVGANERSLADPSKAKFAKATERTLAALKAEQERRAQAKEHSEATGSVAPASEPGQTAPADEGATPIGKLRGDVWTRLIDAGGKKAIPLLQQVTAELFQVERKALSECTEEELRKLATIPEDVLKTAAAAIAAKK